MGITIAALLDRASENKRLAESQTEEQREKTTIVGFLHCMNVIPY